MSACDRYVYAIEEKHGRMIYVGVGKGNRWAHHLSQARRGITGKCNPAKGQYLIHCLAAGIELEIYKIAENLSIDEACKLEIEIIDLLGRRDLGTGPLLNGCGGGNGVKNPAPSTRAKLSESARKQNLSPEFRALRMEASRLPEARAKVSAASRKRMSSPEARAKASALGRSNVGRPASPEARANMSAFQRGRKHSPDHVAKVAEAQRGKTVSPETRAKLIKAHRGMSGRKHTPETRAKIAEAARKQWAERANVI